MNLHRILATAGALFVVAACSETAETPATNQADDFASRINSGQSSQAAPAAAPAPVGDQTPTVAPPLENAAPGSFAAGTATDPSSRCGANTMGAFIGMPASDQVRGQIMEAAKGVQEIRFMAPGSPYLKPDPTHPRLNIMVATDGIIRDIRCG